MSRTAIISVDGHVKASRAGYREYVEKKYRDDYDASVKAAEDEGLPDAGNLNPEYGYEAQWDSDRRLETLESQGVVAEVLFPNGQPFQVNRLEDFGRADNPELASRRTTDVQPVARRLLRRDAGAASRTSGRVLRRHRAGDRGHPLGQRSRPRRDHDAGAQSRRESTSSIRCSIRSGLSSRTLVCRSASTAAPVFPATARRGSRRS